MTQMKKKTGSTKPLSSRLMSVRVPWKLWGLTKYVTFPDVHFRFLDTIDHDITFYTCMIVREPL